jgi:hypothetical protein
MVFSFSVAALLNWGIKLLHAVSSAGDGRISGPALG